MPNLLQIQKLNDIYSRYYPSHLHRELNEDRLEKGFHSALIEDCGNEYDQYFKLDSKVNVALLYIDICSFSERYLDCSSSDLSQYLDSYYARVIPIIYEFGGEIDRIMGDGIIAVFGPPFLNLNQEDLLIKALASAVQVIVLTKPTEFYSKVALHFGQIQYYRNKTAQYPEYTIIGKPITELYRLESIAIDNSIGYYADSYIDFMIEQYKEKGKFPLYNNTRWHCSRKISINPPLKGVDRFNGIKYIQSL